MRKWKLLHQQLHLPWNQKGSLYINYIGMTTSNVSMGYEIQASCFQWRLERKSVFLPIKRKSVEKSVDPKLDVKNNRWVLDQIPISRNHTIDPKPLKVSCWVGFRYLRTFIPDLPAGLKLPTHPTVSCPFAGFNELMLWKKQGDLVKPDKNNKVKPILVRFFWMIGLIGEQNLLGLLSQRRHTDDDGVFFLAQVMSSNSSITRGPIMPSSNLVNIVFHGLLG